MFLSKYQFKLGHNKIGGNPHPVSKNEHMYMYILIISMRGRAMANKMAEVKSQLLTDATIATPYVAVQEPALTKRILATTV